MGIPRNVTRDGHERDARVVFDSGRREVGSLSPPWFDSSPFRRGRESFHWKTDANFDVPAGFSFTLEVT